MKRFLRSTLIAACRWLLVLVVLLACCQSKLIYHPRVYSADYIQSRQAEALSYTTAQGLQVAWMINSKTVQPPRVWLVFTGNGTCALDMAPYFRAAEPLKNDLIVLVDYPGYGRSEGRPTPNSIRESIRALLPAVAHQLRTPPEAVRARLRVFGHSLGCASALMAMNEHGIQRGVLVAPFTSMLDMAQGTVGWPLCYVLHHRFDNVAALQQLRNRGHCHLEVIHGTQDEVIPLAQGRSLAAGFPEIITFHPADRGSHNGILNTHRSMIMEALAAARQD